MTHTISPRTTSPPSYQGWPKLLFAVYERDATALVDSFVGYGVAALPLSPGAHDVSACVFVANDRNARLAQSARDYFTAARPELEGWRAQMLRRDDVACLQRVVAEDLEHGEQLRVARSPSLA